MTNPTDPKVIQSGNRDALQKQKNARDAELDDIRAVLQTEQGRRFFWRILEMAAVFQNPYTGNADTHFKCGRQVIGTTLIADVHSRRDCFELYMHMQQEAFARAEEAACAT